MVRKIKTCELEVNPKNNREEEEIETEDNIEKRKRKGEEGEREWK